MNDNNRYDNITTEIQTRIHVQPHILGGEKEKALVTCERACQTAVSSFPDIEDRVFYSLLEFIPYKEIDNNAVRILDLPRKQRLQFKLPETEEENEDTSSTTSSASYSDTQRKPPPKKALKHIKLSSDSSSSDDVLTTSTTILETTTKTENHAQTSLTVLPHVLEENEVAKIFESVFVQADAKVSLDSHKIETIAEPTDPSQIKTNILSELIAKIKALNDLNETKCKHYIVCTNENESCTCSCKKNENADPESCALCGCNSFELSSIKFALSCHINCEEKHTQTYLQDFLITTYVQTNRSESGEKSITLEERRDEPAEGSGINHLKAVSSAEREVISSVPQTGRGFKVISEEKALSSEAKKNLIGCTYYENSEMSSKIPVPVNRRSNCPSNLALCQQGEKGPRSGSGITGEEEGKKLICMIKIRTKNDADVDIKNVNEKKTVSLNTAGEKHDTEASTEATETTRANKCTCKSENKKDSFVPLSEIEAIYFEHYVEELQHSSTGVQTETYTESESIDSLPGLQEAGTCEDGTEIPWQKLALSSPYEYTIRSSKKEEPEKLDEETTQDVAKSPPPTKNKILVEQTPEPKILQEQPPAEAAEDEEPTVPPVEEQLPYSPAEDDVQYEGEEEETPAAEPPAEPQTEPPIEPPSEPPTEPPAEKKKVFDDTSCRDPLKLLANTGDALLYNEPYMDIMLKLFPDPHEHCPPNETEIPWKEILLPRYVKLRKQNETEQQAKGTKDKYSGLFISAESKSTDVDIILKANTPEKPSCPIAVKGGAASQVTISVCSSISGYMSKPKRNGKDTKLCVRVGSSQSKSGGKKGENKSEVLAVVDANCSSGKTVETDTGSKRTVDTKCSCKKPLDANTGNTVDTKSSSRKVADSKCSSAKCSSRKPIETKKSNSMPNIPSKMSNKCTGESSVKIPLSATSICIVTVKSSADASSKTPPKKQNQSTKSCGCKSSTSPPTVKTKSSKSSTKCCACKQTHSKSSFNKQDAVAAALEVYESEMKPLKAALKQLQEKIRSLNMTDMDQCWCGPMDDGLGSNSYNMPTIPICEIPLSSSPLQYPFSQLMSCSTPKAPSYSAVPDKPYQKKPYAAVDTSKRCDGACSTKKGKKKSPSRKKSPDEGKAYGGCSSSNLSETPSSAYKCPFTELVHSISNRTLSDDDCKSKCGSKNKSSSRHRFPCTSKISSTFDSALFDSRRGIRTEPARNSSSIKTKVFSRSQR